MIRLQKADCRGGGGTASPLCGLGGGGGACRGTVVERQADNDGPVEGSCTSLHTIPQHTIPRLCCLLSLLLCTGTTGGLPCLPTALAAGLCQDRAHAAMEPHA